MTNWNEQTAKSLYFKPNNWTKGESHTFEFVETKPEVSKTGNKWVSVNFLGSKDDKPGEWTGPTWMFDVTQMVDKHGPEDDNWKGKLCSVVYDGTIFKIIPA